MAPVVLLCAEFRVSIIVDWQQQQQNDFLTWRETETRPHLHMGLFSVWSHRAPMRCGERKDWQRQLAISTGSVIQVFSAAGN